MRDVGPEAQCSLKLSPSEPFSGLCQVHDWVLTLTLSDEPGALTGALLACLNIAGTLTIVVLIGVKVRA